MHRMHRINRTIRSLHRELTGEMIQPGVAGVQGTGWPFPEIILCIDVDQESTHA